MHSSFSDTASSHPCHGNASDDDGSILVVEHGRNALPCMEGFFCHRHEPQLMVFTENWNPGVRCFEALSRMGTSTRLRRLRQQQITYPLRSKPEDLTNPETQLGTGVKQLAFYGTLQLRASDLKRVLSLRAAV